MSTFYTLKATKKDGSILDFSEFKGKTVLIVNTASAWYDS
jgi:glutathione peroxidase-family protein